MTAVRWHVRALWLCAILLALFAAVLVLVRTARPSLQSLASIDISWSLLVLASLVWLASFGYLVLNWARSLRWWEFELTVTRALRIFFLSNLGRYIPGAIWQFAGLAALSSATGVSPVAATGAVVLQQLVLLLTGAALAAFLAPGLLGEWTERLHPLWLVASAALALCATIIILPWLLSHVRPFVLRRLQGRVSLPVVTPANLATYTLRTTVGWVGYGLAFWLFSRALFGAAAPTPLAAAVAFIAASVLGIAAVFAPGGIVIREVAIAGALAATLGLERASVLAIASRVWLIALEILGALVILAYAPQAKANAESQGRSE